MSTSPPSSTAAVREPWMVAVALPASAALVLCVLQLSMAHVLFGVDGYDDGVYFGSALRLVHGALPYKDFVFLEPPGIALLLSPIALLTRWIGTDAGLAICRLLTAAITVLNVALVGLLVRYRGKAAVVVAATTLALFPLAVTADNTLLLEPYLTLFVLIGLLLAFDHGMPTLNNHRALWGGVLFGLAGSIKAWAILPVLAVVICFILARRAPHRVVIGTIVGFALPCAPFVVSAPRAFLHDVIGAQISRGAVGSAALGLAGRIVDLTGIAGLPVLHASALISLLIVIAGAVVAVVVFGRSPVDSFDLTVILSLCFLLAAMLSTSEFYSHYAYFPAGFAALLAGLGVSRVPGLLGRGVEASREQRARRHVRRLLVLTALVVIGGLVFVEDLSYSHQFVHASAAIDPRSVIDGAVPPGACVVFDEPALAIAANRFSSSVPGCPAVDDPFGTWISLDPAHPPPSLGPYPVGLVRTWHGFLSPAGYVVLHVLQSDYLPWDSSITPYFLGAFRLVAAGPGVFVYGRALP